MVRIMALLVLLITSQLSVAQNKELQFQQTVQDFISAFNAKDPAKFKPLINRQEGLTILYRIGAYDVWRNDLRTCLAQGAECNINEAEEQLYQTLFHLGSEQLPTHYPLTYSRYPKIECEHASKKGLFVNTKYRDRTYSNLIKKYLDGFDIFQLWTKEILTEELNIAYRLEPVTRKVILAYPVSAEYDHIVMFHLSWLQNQWYVTMIDFATPDCSA